MNTEMLLKEFREILGREEKARTFYDHYIEEVTDERIKEKLISIRNDEIAHIKIARKLIELAS